MSVLPRVAVLLLALGATATAWAGQVEQQRANNAVRVLNEIQAIPESAIPVRLFDQARAIVVVPDTLKIGLVFGGRRGHGLVSVKSPDGTWSNPSFIKLTGGSIGFQAGVQSSDIVLVFTGERGLESIVNGKVTLGADASVAAGPVGRTTALATDGQLQAEIWSWSRARGLFAGVALDGAVLTIDDEANQAVYGAGSTPRMVFEGRTAPPSADAVVTFRDQLEEATAAAHMSRNLNVAPAGTATTPATVVAPAPMPAPQAQPQPFETVESPTRIEPLP